MVAIAQRRKNQTRHRGHLENSGRRLSDGGLHERTAAAPSTATYVFRPTFRLPGIPRRYLSSSDAPLQRRSILFASCEATIVQGRETVSGTGEKELWRETSSSLRCSVTCAPSERGGTNSRRMR